MLNDNLHLRGRCAAENMYENLWFKFILVDISFVNSSRNRSSSNSSTSNSKIVFITKPTPAAHSLHFASVEHCDFCRRQHLICFLCRSVSSSLCRGYT